MRCGRLLWQAWRWCAPNGSVAGGGSRRGSVRREGGRQEQPRVQLGHWEAAAAGGRATEERPQLGWGSVKRAARVMCSGDMSTSTPAGSRDGSDTRSESLVPVPPRRATLSASGPVAWPGALLGGGRCCRGTFAVPAMRGCHRQPAVLPVRRGTPAVTLPASGMPGGIPRPRPASSRA